MAAISTRAAVATFHLALIEVLEAAGVVPDHNIDDITVNINYRLHRIDIAKLSEDGLHIGEWVCAFSLDPHDLPTFGTPVGMPGVDGPTH